MSSTIWKINRGEFGLALVDPGKPVADASIADYSDFSCRVTSGALTASQNIETDEVPGTFCSPAQETNTPTATTFVLDLSLLQDPHVQALSGLQKFLWDNDSGVSGQTAYFYLGLDQGKAPKVIGECWLAPIDFGGEARVVLTADVEFPVEGRPEIEFGEISDTEQDLTESVFSVSPAPFNDIASLKADPVYGDGGSSAPVDMTTGQFVRLIDQSLASYALAAWTPGAAAVAASRSKKASTSSS